MDATIEYAPAGITEIIGPQNTKTTSISLMLSDVEGTENFYELRNNSAFNFWNSSEEDQY
jgi:hypothetical protein